MPDMDGIEAAQLMSGSDPTVPIILFTALDLDGLETRAHNAGICAVVRKHGVGISSRASRLRSRNPHEKCVAHAGIRLSLPHKCKARLASIRSRARLSIAGAYLAMPNPFSKGASIQIKISTQSTQRSSSKLMPRSHAQPMDSGWSDVPCGEPAISDGVTAVVIAGAKGDYAAA